MTWLIGKVTHTGTMVTIEEGTTGTVVHGNSYIGRGDDEGHKNYHSRW